MDRRKFIGAVAGGLVAGPLVAPTEAQETHLGDPGGSGAMAAEARRSTGSAIREPLPAVVFRKGVAQRISLASQLPRGDRYSGGYFDQAPGYKSVFVLHDVQGLEHNEIAQQIGCSIGNSKSQLHKARMKLRELLKQRAGTAK